MGNFALENDSEFNEYDIEYTDSDRMILSVAGGSENKRIDSFIAENTEFTRTRIQYLIKEGNITVNDRKVKASYKLEKDDVITIVIPEIEKTEIIPENINIDIVYEDEDIAVINKQAGLVVHPAHGHYSGTLVNSLLYHIRDLSGINGELRPGIVHRLDKDTSGLLIIAKNDKAHSILTRMFQNKEIRKTYLAVLKGKLNKNEGRIITQIGRDRNDRKKMAVVSGHEGGKTAITNYRIISQNEVSTFVEVNIETGRTHQIRVHMKYLGYPILGDCIYGRKDSEKRQMLHAYSLEFNHPVTGRLMKVKGEPPEDFKKVLNRMNFQIREADDKNE